MVNIKKGIRQDERLLKNIFSRFQKRDFSGNTGQAIKNSSYQLAQNLIFKFGSLIFTIILANILMLEKMGLYSLALSTILLITAFADLGISQALMVFVSRSLGKKDLGKAKGYTKLLFGWKLKLIIIAGLIMIPAAWFISKFIYPDKSMFFVLLAGVLYIPIISLIDFIEQIFKSANNFKIPLIKEIIFQILRFTIIPLIILFSLSLDLSNQKVVFLTLISIIGIYLFALIFFAVLLKKKLKFLKSNLEEIKVKDKKSLKNFIFPLSAMAMAGMFFSYVDMVMLGHYVSEGFIAYYGAAFPLMGAAATIASFMSISLMPIFAKKSGKSLKDLFNRSKKINILISILTGIFVFFIAKLAIKIIYPAEFLPAVPILRLFSVLVVLIPMITLYVSYYTTQKRTKILAVLILSSSVLNIVFNFIGINYGLNNFGELGAVYGACIATILSRAIYLLGLRIFR